MRAAIVGICVSGSVALAAALAHGQAANPSPAGALPPWRVPDIAALPDDDFGKAARYGRALIQHTSALIGPDAADPAMRFSGNGLECKNCHLEAGTARFALPLVGVWGSYPAFSARQGKIQTMADRINDCMLRSMNGRPLPQDSREMRALESYISFLSSDQPTASPPVGRGAPRLPLPDRAADPMRGAAVYDTECAGCHGADGSGERYSPAAAKENQQRYLFPPLWGPDSYNNGAGMARNITAAWFVCANMPRGITFAYPILTPEQAYDVAAYVNEQTRPQMRGLQHDYPDPWLKPADAAYPPLLGPFSTTQHEFGPWPPLEAWLKANMPTTVNGPRYAGDLQAMARADPTGDR